MNSIVFENVCKSYGDAKIVKSLNLEIKEGERLILLGPSGCGKTTTLRMIAGLEDITSGQLKMGGRVVNDIAPGERNIAMVFQSYALFPHLSVWDNITFGLHIQKLPEAEIKKRADEALEILNLRGYENYKPKQLSGGQKQRVALCRALVKQSPYFLLDEPLSNLDAQLRQQARTELVRIHEIYKPTMIYVTHDQEEALAVSDRIAIMNNGIIQQIGTPKEIYQRPNCVFVATFIGLSNILEAKVKITGAAEILDFGAYEVPMDNLIPEISAGSKVLVSVRPEEFEICLNGSDGLTAVVEHSVFLGVTTHYFVRLENGQEIEVIQNSGVEDTIPNKTTVRLLVQPAKINVFTEDGNTPLIVRGNR